MSDLKKIFLTIDDSPSVDFQEKINFLHENAIPAIIFGIGKEMEKYPDAVVDAIRKGYVIGNHSYSHPHFSSIPLAEAKSEIEKTDQIIDELYTKADIARPAKLFRFPLGDKGWAKEIHRIYKLFPAWIYFTLKRRAKNVHQQKIQSYLQQMGYHHPRFGDINYPFYHNLGLYEANDVYWTFDFLEYNARHVNEVLAQIEQPGIREIINNTHCRVGSLIDPTSDDIALIHDHHDTTEWFYRALKKCLDMDMNFTSIY